METAAKLVSESPRTVLLVEDDEALAYAISRHLKARGYGVTTASGSMAALRELDNGCAFDAAVIDINLQPGEPHGLALARMMALSNPSASVLFVTGRKDLIEIAGVDPDQVLFKPVELNELARKVGELLGG